MGKVKYPIFEITQEENAAEMRTPLHMGLLQVKPMRILILMENGKEFIQVGTRMTVIRESNEQVAFDPEREYQIFQTSVEPGPRGELSETVESFLTRLFSDGENDPPKLLVIEEWHAAEDDNCVPALTVFYEREDTVLLVPNSTVYLRIPDERTFFEEILCKRAETDPFTERVCHMVDDILHECQVQVLFDPSGHTTILPQIVDLSVKPVGDQKKVDAERLFWEGYLSYTRTHNRVHININALPIENKYNLWMLDIKRIGNKEYLYYSEFLHESPDI